MTEQEFKKIKRGLTRLANYHKGQVTRLNTCYDTSDPFWQTLRSYHESAAYLAEDMLFKRQKEFFATNLKHQTSNPER